MTTSLLGAVLLASAALSALPADPDARVAPSLVTLRATRSADALLAELRVQLAARMDVRLPEQGTLPGIVHVASGVAIDGAGHIVTTASFVAAGGEILAELHDGRDVAVRVLGLDEASDLALLELGNARIPPAPFAPATRRLAPGMRVRLLGSAPPLRCAATEGTLLEARLHPRTGLLHDFLLVGANPPPGSAGGAVLDPMGDVIGMISAARRGGGALAVPATTMLRVGREILECGRVERAWLGVTVLSHASASPRERGARVMGVVSDSPAEQAGIAPGDLILAYDQHPVTGMATLIERVLEGRPGTRVRIRAERDGHVHDTYATLGARPNSARTSGVVVHLEDQRAYLGLQVEESGSSAGVRVTSVAPESPAAAARLAPGDTVRSVAGQSMTGPAELASAVREHAPGDWIDVTIERGERVFERRIQLGTRPVLLLSELPRFHLALDPGGWQAVREALRSLPAESQARGADAIRRALEARAPTLDDASRSQVEQWRRDLERLTSSRPPPGN